MLNKKKWTLMVTTAIISASSGFGMESSPTADNFKNHVRQRMNTQSESLEKAIEWVLTNLYQDQRPQLIKNMQDNRTEIGQAFQKFIASQNLTVQSSSYAASINAASIKSQVAESSPLQGVASLEDNNIQSQQAFQFKPEDGGKLKNKYHTMEILGLAENEDGAMERLWKTNKESRAFLIKNYKDVRNYTVSESICADVDALYTALQLAQETFARTGEISDPDCKRLGLFVDPILQGRKISKDVSAFLNKYMQKRLELNDTDTTLTLYTQKRLESNGTDTAIMQCQLPRDTTTAGVFYLLLQDTRLPESLTNIWEGFLKNLENKFFARLWYNQNDFLRKITLLPSNYIRIRLLNPRISTEERERIEDAVYKNYSDEYLNLCLYTRVDLGISFNKRNCTFVEEKLSRSFHREHPEIVSSYSRKKLPEMLEEVNNNPKNRENLDTLVLLLYCDLWCSTFLSDDEANRVRDALKPYFPVMCITARWIKNHTYDETDIDLLNAQSGLEDDFRDPYYINEILEDHKKKSSSH